MITGTSRGHKIIYENNQWVYLDTREPVDNKRPCLKCGKIPTVEGYDACLGFIPGIKSACCGHGVSEKIMIYEI